MNIIAIDPSLSCTAMCVNGKFFVYAADTVALSKKTLKPTGWFNEIDHLATVRVHNNDVAGSYADKERGKMFKYADLANVIALDAYNSIDRTQLTRVFIEGYSFSSQAGPLIDLVTFGTLVRRTVFDKIGTSDIIVIAPTELKMYTAKFTYPAITGKKNETIRNHQGVSGGKFTKVDMYRALVENNTLQDDWIDFLKLHQAKQLTMKNVPKPLEDLNDAKLMYEIAKSNKYF